MTVSRLRDEVTIVKLYRDVLGGVSDGRSDVNTRSYCFALSWEQMIDRRTAHHKRRIQTIHCCIQRSGWWSMYRWSKS